MNSQMDDDCIFERKKWISITGLCNNNCLFCLDKGREDTHHKDTDQLKKEIKQAYEEGNTKLILSGGDPTIHPDVIELVRYGRKLGYGKIQIITNGRMFSSKKYTEEMVDAGLDEVTFSIHGFSKEIHDGLTQVPGSFAQIIRGVQNVKMHDLIINTDTCITGSNYHLIPKTIRFIVEKLGINEVNLMTMVPQGNAWSNRDRIMCDYGKIAPYVRSVIDYCVKRDVVLWLSRFPPKYLEGYEHFIEDPYKLVDEVRGRLDTIKAGLPCKGPKCDFCNLAYICDDLVNRKTLAYDKKITITEKNYKDLKDPGGRVFLEMVVPERVSKYRTPMITEVAKYLGGFDRENVYVEGIPACVLQGAGIRSMQPVDHKDVDYDAKPLDLAWELARRAKTKKEKCDRCIYNSDCQGIYINYARKFGFSEIEPVRNAEIRINLGCNQDCIFCNTDENSENILMKKKDVEDRIKSLAAEGVRYLVITGKEPTLDNHLLGYVKLAEKEGFTKIEVQTNATLLGVELCDRLRRAGVTDAFVSLHAHNEKLSSRITRAPGTFDKTISGIKNLKAAGINVTINVVVNKLNHRYLSEIIKFISRLRPQSVVFSIVAPVLDADDPDILPRYSDIKDDLNAAFDYCIKNNIKFHIPSRCGIPICFVEKHREHHDDFNTPGRFSSADKIKSRSCRSCDYDSRCPGVWKSYARIYGLNELNKPGKNLDINLGKVCNNDCMFCMSKHPGLKPRFVSKELIKKDISSSEGFSKVTFLGGEPTIYPDLVELVKFSRANGFDNVHIISNGRRFADMKYLRRIIDAGTTDVSVSIHSHDEKTENRLTQTNGFSEKIMGLENLRKLNVRTYINMVVNTLNFKKLEESISFFRELGVTHFRLNSMMPDSGNAKLNIDLLPRFQDIAKVIERIDRKGINLTVGDFPPCVFSLDESDVYELIGECSQDRITQNISYNTNRADIERSEFVWKERKSDMKSKPDSCVSCRLGNVCEGIWKGYLRRYGENEFRPR